MIILPRSPRGLTREQVRCVLAWYARWRQFRGEQETAEALAKRLRVKRHVVYYCLTRAAPSHGQRGRPGRLRPREIKAVFAWRRRFQRFLVRHGRARDLAAKLGVSRGAIYECIRRHRGPQSASGPKAAGFPEVPPERRPRRATETEAVLRSRLLRRWGATGSPRERRSKPPPRNRMARPLRVRDENSTKRWKTSDPN